MINTVLFDLDGTIINTADVIIGSWQHTYRKLSGKEGDRNIIVKTMGEPLAVSLKNAFPHVPVEESLEIYRSFHRNSFKDTIDIFPGMKDLIEELKDRKYSLSVVTSRMRGTTEEALEKYGIKDLFDYIVTCDDTDKHKPDPEPILVALRKLSKGPDESIMVGDSIFDILCARNAKVKSALVGWTITMTEEEALKGDAPDYIIKKPEDLLRVIL